MQFIDGCVSVNSLLLDSKGHSSSAPSRCCQAARGAVPKLGSASRGGPERRFKDWFDPGPSLTPSCLPLPQRAQASLLDSPELALRWPTLLLAPVGSHHIFVSLVFSGIFRLRSYGLSGVRSSRLRTGWKPGDVLGASKGTDCCPSILLFAAQSARVARVRTKSASRTGRGSR
jgi:hypothetical protein